MTGGRATLDFLPYTFLRVGDRIRFTGLPEIWDSPRYTLHHDSRRFVEWMVATRRVTRIAEIDEWGSPWTADIRGRQERCQENWALFHDDLWERVGDRRRRAGAAPVPKPRVRRADVTYVRCEPPDAALAAKALHDAAFLAWHCTERHFPVRYLAPGPDDDVESWLARFDWHDYVPKWFADCVSALPAHLDAAARATAIAPTALLDHALARDATGDPALARLCACHARLLAGQAHRHVTDALATDISADPSTWLAHHRAYATLARALTDAATRVRRGRPLLARAESRAAERMETCSRGN